VILGGRRFHSELLFLRLLLRQFRLRTPPSLDFASTGRRMHAVKVKAILFPTEENAGILAMELLFVQLFDSERRKNAGKLARELLSVQLFDSVSQEMHICYYMDRRTRSRWRQLWRCLPSICYYMLY
jgi:hypothetical protein